jgi:hypothetical protein
MINYEFRLNDEEFKVCKDFSVSSAKSQREYRSGGSQFRSIGMIESDTLRGKVGEFIVKKFLQQSPFNINGIKLDFNVYERGVWDEKDFNVGSLNFSVKSAKWFSRWLLLESKDINRGDVYDVYVFVTIEKDFKSGTIKGFTTKDEVLNGPNTLELNRGDYIPNTNTTLDAANHAIHSDHLHNSVDDWKELLIN